MYNIILQALNSGFTYSIRHRNQNDYEKFEPFCRNGFKYVKLIDEMSTDLQNIMYLELDNINELWLQDGLQYDYIKLYLKENKEQYFNNYPKFIPYVKLILLYYILVYLYTKFKIYKNEEIVFMADANKNLYGIYKRETNFIKRVSYNIQPILIIEITDMYYYIINDKNIKKMVVKFNFGSDIFNKEKESSTTEHNGRSSMEQRRDQVSSKFLYR